MKLGALLDMFLANRNRLLDEVVIGGHFNHSDHCDHKIFGNMRKKMQS